MTVVDAPDWGFKQGDFIVYQASGQWKIKFVTSFDSGNGSIETWGLTYDMKHGDGDHSFDMDFIAHSHCTDFKNRKWRFATVFEVEAFWRKSKDGSYNVYAGFYSYLHDRREEWKKVHFDKGLAIPDDIDGWVQPSYDDINAVKDLLKFPIEEVPKVPEFPKPVEAPERSELLPVVMKPFEVTDNYASTMDNALTMIITNLTDNYDCLTRYGRSKDAEIVKGILQRLDLTIARVEEGVELAQVKSIQPNTLFYFEERQILYEYLFYQWEDNEIMLYGNCLDLDTNYWLHTSEHDLQGMSVDHLKKLVPANQEQSDFYYKAMTWAVEFDRLIYDVRNGDRLVDPLNGDNYEFCSYPKLAIEAVKEGVLEMQIPCDFNEKQAGEIEYEYDFVRYTLDKRPIPIQEGE